MSVVKVEARPRKKQKARLGGPSHASADAQTGIVVFGLLLGQALVAPLFLGAAFQHQRLRSRA